MKMRMRFIKKGLFLSILIIILVVMNFWMDREGNPHYPLQYEEVFHPKVNADMVILGASHATHGINPKYLEKDHLKVFNFALNGAGPYFYLKWYEKIFQRCYRKPAYVLYGVHWVMFENHTLQRQLEHDSKYFPRYFLFEEFRDLKTMKTLILNQFAFVRERKKLPYRLARLFEKHRGGSVYVLSKYYNGFVPYERKGRLDKKKGSKPQNDIVQIRAFEELLDELGKNKIQVIFAHIPGYLPARDDSDISESIQLIHKIAEERKIPFLDYETERITSINTDPRLFSDWVHLNEKGSEAFSKLLRSDLELLLKQKKTCHETPRI
jgi:hypothetical protein